MPTAADGRPQRQSAGVSDAADFEELRQFLLAHVETHEELEVLLLLFRTRDAVLRLGQIFAAVTVPEETCRVALAALCQKGLIAERGEGPGYQYACTEASSTAHVERLEHTYQGARVLLIQIMNNNAVERVRTSARRAFSDAFRSRDPKK